MSKQYKKVLCSGITWSTLFILLFAVNIVASTPKFEMVEELRTSVVKNLLFVTSFFKLVRIEKLVVPELVDIISNDVILDCQFTTVDDNFTLQWIFNDGVTPVYEWTPYSEPKVAGILDERLDLTYRVSRFSRDERRALRITNLTSELSGEYTCIVSNHGTEVRKTKAMLIYSVERDFQLTAENRPNSTVIFLTCTARGVYPRPDLTLEYNNAMVSGQLQRVVRNDEGLYDVMCFAYADVYAVGIKSVVACRLFLPQADYTAIKKKIIFNGGNQNFISSCKTTAIK
ncbi:uncharacterized protein LOC113497634 isoform X2 [Trichoplusia ni]|uniref:Uncharacterized protein LOC113497634 isoform X2 n=1 Tax=Trichoplusia ni TaxID=7111 RepID=A0A7E5VXH7_TRINI|nr:uncharacterized protein LOC113497634 isoform X2 [Trichoplusia ni]